MEIKISYNHGKAETLTLAIFRNYKIVCQVQLDLT